MGVRIQIPSYLRRAVGVSPDIQVEGGTVLECLRDLVRRHPRLEEAIFDDQGKVLLKWMIYVNDRAYVGSSSLCHPVGNDDSIGLYPLSAGG